MSLFPALTGSASALPLPGTAPTPAAGELVRAEDIQEAVQALLDQDASLEDDKLSAPGGVVSGDLMITGNLDVGDTLSADAITSGTSVAAAGDVTAGGGVTSAGNINAGAAVHFTGTQPASNADPGARNTYDTNQIKVLAIVTTDGAGNATVVDGFNVASVAIVSGRVEITFVRAFATATYAPATTMLLGVPDIAVPDYANSTASKVAVKFFSDSVTSIAPSLSVLRFSVQITGRQ